VERDRFNFILACENESLRSFRDMDVSWGCRWSVDSGKLCAGIYPERDISMSESRRGSGRGYSCDILVGNMFDKEYKGAS